VRDVPSLVPADNGLANLATELLPSRPCAAVADRRGRPRRCAAAMRGELRTVSAGPPCPACAGRELAHSSAATVLEQALALRRLLEHEAMFE